MILRKENELNGGNQPKYQKLIDILRKTIIDGRIAPGKKLCTEAELKKRYKLSTATVTHALRELEIEGLIKRCRGGGTFVSTNRISLRPSVNRNRTVFVSGVLYRMQSFTSNVNWFITHEIYKGITNSFDGPCRIISPEEVEPLVRKLPQEDRNFILINPRPGLAGFLRENNVNYVTIRQSERQSVPEINTVGLDYMKGIYDGMSYLINTLGHRDIAFITAGDEKSQHLHSGRIAGYEISLHAFKIHYRDELVYKVTAPATEYDGDNAMKAIIERGVKFSAVFADTDVKAFGAIRELKKIGIRVPEDVSILGFDDVPGADETEPPLTTIRIPRYEMGRQAVEMLNQRIESGGADMPGVILESSLIIRESCKHIKNP